MEASERLYFRELKNTDVDALIAIYSDAEAMQFRANPPILTVHDAQQMIQSAIQKEEHFASNRLAVVLNTTNELIGTFVFKKHKNTFMYTIGYSIGKAFWNKGYGKELLSAMIKHLKTSGCTLVQAFVHSKNLASIAILEKQEFQIIEIDEINQLVTYHLQL